MHRVRVDKELRAFKQFLQDECVQLSSIENILTSQEIMEDGDFPEIFDEFEGGKTNNPQYIPTKFKKRKKEKMYPRADLEPMPVNTYRKYSKMNSGNNINKFLEELESELDQEEKHSAHQATVSTDWRSLKPKDESVNKKKKKRNSCCGGFF